MSRIPVVLACVAAALLPACPRGAGRPGSQPTWAKSYGTAFIDYAAAGAPLPEGGYVLAATRNVVESSNPRSDAWLIGVDANGDLMWQRALGRQGGLSVPGRPGLWHYPIVAVPAPNGGAFVVSNDAASDNALEDEDLLVAYLDGTGAVVWQRRYGLDAVDGERLYYSQWKPRDIFQRAQPTRDGGLVIAAVSHATIDVDPHPDTAIARTVLVPWFMRLAPNGEVLWRRQIVDDVLRYDPSYDPSRSLSVGFVTEAARRAVGREGDTFFWIGHREDEIRYHTRLGRIDPVGGVRVNARLFDFRARGGAVSEAGRLLLVGEGPAARHGSIPVAEVRCFDVDDPVGNYGRWQESFEEAARWRGVGVAPCQDPVCSGFVAVRSEGEEHHLVWLREEDGATVADRSVSSLSSVPYDASIVIGARVEGDESFHTDLFGRLAGSTRLQRFSLAWASNDLAVHDMGEGVGLVRDETGETCVWTYPGFVRRLDPTYGTLWESRALASDEGPHVEEALDLHMLPRNPNAGRTQGCLLVGAWEVDGGFAPWLVRFDLTADGAEPGLPVWSRVTGTGQQRAFGRAAVSALLEDGSVVVAQHSDASSVVVTRFLDDGTATWRLSMEAAWPGPTAVFAMGAAGPSSFAIVSGATFDEWLRLLTFGNDGTLLSSRRIKLPRDTYGAACAIDPTGILLTGTEGGHVFLVDLAADGTARHASTRKWQPPWVIRPEDLRVARGPEGEVYIATTIHDDPPPDMRRSGRDWTLMRVSPERAWEWAQAYGGLLDERLLGMQALPDGALLMGRSTSVEVNGDAWVLRVGPDGRIVVGGGCQAELERVEDGETVPFEVVVENEALPAVTRVLPPFEDVLEVETPSLLVNDTVVARQCFGFSTPEPDPDLPPGGGGNGGTAGSGILFARYDADSHDREIWSIAVAGGTPVPLTDNDWEDLDPAWSPDGRQIAFVSDEGEAGAFELFLMNADGSSRHKVSDFRGSGLSAKTPAWSPQGDRIVVAAEENRSFKSFQILVLATGEASVLPGAQGWMPAWSPSSDILFATSDGFYRVNPDSGEAPVRIPSPAILPIGGPAWSPLADRIAFAQYSFASNSARLAVMNADGTGLVNLTVGGGHVADFGPAWYAAGSRIAFVREANPGETTLWTIDSTGATAAEELPGQQGTVLGEPDAR